MVNDSTWGLKIHKQGGTNMGFSMGVYGDLMGIFMGSFMGFTGREIYIFSGWWLTYPSEKI